MNSRWLSVLTVAVAGLGFATGLPGEASAKDKLSIYSGLEPDEVKLWTERFNRDHPDIELNIVRGSTGTLTARILAERSNPQADLIWRLAITSLIILDNEGLLQPYKPKDYDKLNAKFKDKKDPPAWAGHNGFEAAVCFNTVEAAKTNAPVPKTWKDLANPAYKGHIVMPNPASSGTGFLDVSSWLQMFGNDEAWKYMDALHNNMKFYVHSGSKPCNLAASGETMIGVSAGVTAARLKAKGAPIEVIFPSEGLGWELEGSALLKGTKNLAVAQKFLDWAISDNAIKLYNEGYPIVGRPELAKPVQYYPADIMDRLIKNDFWWASANRDKILADWKTRYDAKSEPRP